MNQCQPPPGGALLTTVYWLLSTALLLVVRPQLLQHGEVFEGGRVAVGRAGGGDLAEQAAHDLAGARLGERVGEAYLVGAGERADLARDVAAQLLLQLVGRAPLAFERDEGDDALTLHLVGPADDRRLRHRLVRDERALDLHRPQTVPRDVDDV